MVLLYVKAMINGINISSAMKQLRRTSGYTAKDVTRLLSEYGIEISEKTLYGYESGVSMPNADTFVALCMIYKCDNPFEIFGGSTISSDEIMLVKKYRCLDERGKDAVLNTLNHEYESIPGEEVDSAAKQA